MFISHTQKNSFPCLIADGTTILLRTTCIHTEKVCKNLVQRYVFLISFAVLVHLYAVSTFNFTYMRLLDSFLTQNHETSLENMVVRIRSLEEGRKIVCYRDAPSSKT